MRRFIRFLSLLALVCFLSSSALAVEDGLYSIDVSSSAEMFRIADCMLEVEEGSLIATLTLGGKGYGYLYQGTGSQAQAAPQTQWTAPVENAEGAYTFRFAIPTLDEPVDVAAYSKKNAKWYDRQLVFHSATMKRMNEPAPQAAMSIPSDGAYTLTAVSDSPLLQIAACKLTVSRGEMEVCLSLVDRGYSRLYLGKAQDALSGQDFISMETDPEGRACYTFSISSLERPLALAAWSDQNKCWYDQTIDFSPDSLKPAQEAGFSFAFTGGTGKTTLTCEGLQQDGEKTLARIRFSSSSYDRVTIDGTEFGREEGQEEAVFLLPVVENGVTEIQAETVAMSAPHWVSYTLYLYTNGADAAALAATPAGDTAPEEAAPSSFSQPPQLQGLTFESTLTPEYARNFVIHRYEGGYRLLQTANGRNYLIVPEGKTYSGDLQGMTALYRPIHSAYLAATSVMCMADALDAMDSLRFSAVKEEGWCVENAQIAMKEGRILYAGKYSAPDYELLLSQGCDLAIESTMLLHAPEVWEKLEELNVPLLIDLSGLEKQPLGRTEWLKVYGAIFDQEEKADKAFEIQKTALNSFSSSPQPKPTVASFFINSTGQAVVKTASDSFSQLVELAGGEGLYPQVPSPDAASVTMDMEAFYALAGQADLLIYNATIQAQPESLTQLLSAHDLLGDFLAIQKGRVLCVSKALYQSSDRFGEAVAELHDRLYGLSEKDEALFFTFLEP